jgi:hydrogenase maturation protease
VKILVAGFGNVFFSDDGFGSAVIRSFGASELVPGVSVHDFGTRGMHLALELSAGYDLAIVVDAVARPAEPGTLFVIEAERTAAQSAVDAHAMDPGGVLAAYEALSRGVDCVRPKILIVGCVPETTEPGMELSVPVRRAVPECVKLLRALTSEFAATGALS